MTATSLTDDQEMAATVLPLVSDPGNHRVLTEWLANHGRYERTDESPDAAEFDICILDSRTLKRKQSILEERKHETPTIVPYLLLVPEKNGSAVHRELRHEHPELWELVDDVIHLPIAKYELDGRVETLLRLREQSRDLFRQQEQLRTIRDKYGGHGIIITDTDGRIEYVNDAFEEQTGYRRAEVLGRTPSLLNAGVQDDAFYEELWETITAGEPWRGEIINQRTLICRSQYLGSARTSCRC